MESVLRYLNFRKFILPILFVLILINIVIVDWWILRAVSVDKKQNALLSLYLSLLQSPSPSPKADEGTCPNACISQIKQATSSQTLLELSITPSPTKKTVTQQSQTVSQSQTTSSAKEFFVPFGTGSSSDDDWTDISGMQAYVDSSQYGKLKSVVFEVSLRIPTGNQVAYARLYNATDKHPVWFSEVSLEGGTPKLVVSQPITLDEGNKLYQVQMKTSLKYTAIIDQARLHITTQ